MRLLTRGGLDWTHKYPTIAAALGPLDVGSAYIDGELCVLNDHGTTSFSGMQGASDVPCSGSPPIAA